MSSATPGRKNPTPISGEDALADVVVPSGIEGHPGYRLVGRLNEGGQATPWMATDLRTEQTVCVTLLRWSPELTADAWARLCEKFRDARDAYRQLHAARITPRVLDFVEPGLPSVRHPRGEAYFRPYMVIEYFEHGDMGHALFRLPPERQRAVAPWLLRRAIELLGKLHNAERAHGDATMENMLAYEAPDGSVAFVAADLLNSHHGTGQTRPGLVWKPGVWVPNEAWPYYRGEWPDAPLSKRCAWDIAVVAASMRRWITCHELPRTTGEPGDYDVHVLGHELWSLLQAMQAGFESADAALRHIDKIKETWTGPWVATWAIKDMPLPSHSGRVRTTSSGTSGAARDRSRVALRRSEWGEIAMAMATSLSAGDCNLGRVSAGRLV